MLVDGKWTTEWQPIQATDAKGAFLRKDSSFRNWVTDDGKPGPSGTGGFLAEPGRYHLYVALICPWACLTLLARKLKGLEEAISVTIVDPTLTDQGWAFGGARGEKDPTLGARYLHELYSLADPNYSGRATVPVLWDKQRKTIVNNESADILRMLGTGFGALAKIDYDLYPADKRHAIDVLSERLYPSLNNGVYRAGFAQSQQAYEESVRGVFAMLDELEAHLRVGPFLFGDRLTEADIRVFVTLIRFDLAYHGLFKCNLRRLADYPNLSHYLKAVLDVPGVSETVNIEHIKYGYYSIKNLNPTGIVPIGPHPSVLPWVNGR